jgi:glycerol-3-phosphate dehydrogenase
MGGPWTAGSFLPGGDFPWDDAADQARDLMARYPFLTDTDATRLVRRYGTLAGDVLGDATGSERMFGAGLYAREVDWLVRNEWASTADDIVWRRTKAGLRMGPDDLADLQRYLGERPS